MQFSQNPISGESRAPITQIQETFQGVENPEYFDIQGYPAVKLRTVYSGNYDNSIKSTSSVTINVLKDKALWTMEVDTTELKREKIKELEEALSTFKFL